MTSSATAGKRILILGAGSGWHADQISAGAMRHGMSVFHASYESLRSSLVVDTAPTDDPAARLRPPTTLTCEAGDLASFDAVVTRTMPAGSLEQITFRLAVLHAHCRSGGLVINSPGGLEIAIDKFATLAEVARLGFPIPETVVVQNRDDALAAFDRLGGDCVIKPLFGGEGRGVMRVQDRQLAWVTFSTLNQLGAVGYIQRFIPPGGRDTRLLVIGDEVFGIRRTCRDDFRTNAMAGASSARVDPTADQRSLALAVTRHLGLQFAAVDLIDSDARPDGGHCVLEVNGIPGWKAAQAVLDVNIGERLGEHLCRCIGNHPRPRFTAPDSLQEIPRITPDDSQRAPSAPTKRIHITEDSR